MHLPQNACYAGLTTLSGNLSVLSDPDLNELISAFCSCKMHKHWVRRVQRDVKAIPKLSEMKEDAEETYRMNFRFIMDDEEDEDMGEGWYDEDDEEDSDDEEWLHRERPSEKDPLAVSTSWTTPPHLNDFTDGDSIIESSDGVRYWVDSAMLEASGFNLSFKDYHHHKVEEPSSTIGLLLRFTRPVRVPDLRFAPFKTLNELAYAAEKYSVWEAIWVCRIFLRYVV